MGSIDPSVLLAGIPRILDLAASGTTAVATHEAALADVTQAWGLPGRLVVTL